MLDKQIFMNSNFSLPIEFEQIDNNVDDRFIRVKIWIAHTGENRNKSIFTKEVLESMIPSLANIPILGFIAVNEDGEEDFTDHREELVFENGKLKIKYLGRAYGLIPEDNNAHFEFRYGDDGVEREYLVTEGLLWKKFDEVEKIFDRDGGFKSQSMELESSSIRGYINDEGYFVFTQAKFEGACILGENVRPAMVSSTIEKFSTNIKDQLREMISELSTAHKKGDEIVNLEEKDTQTKFSDNNNSTIEKGQNKFQEQEKEQGQGNNVSNDLGVQEEGTNNNSFTENKDKFTITRTFELSLDDVRTQMWNKIDAHMASQGFEDDWYYIVNVYQTYLIVENESGNNFYKVAYTIQDNNVVLGDVEEVFPMFLTADEKTTIDNLRANFEAIEKEVKELREFKANAEIEQKKEQLSKYASLLTKEEYESIEKNLSKFSVEDVEKEIGLILLRKNKFSTDEQDGTLRVKAQQQKEHNPYGSLQSYFYKE